jgi:hypothetical protein
MSEMDRAQLKKAYRNAWILLLIVTAFVAVFFWFTVRANEDHPPVEWDMGGVEFVPAGSAYANGYHAPAREPAEDAPFETE